MYTYNIFLGRGDWWVDDNVILLFFTQSRWIDLLLFLIFCLCNGLHRTYRLQGYNKRVTMFSQLSRGGSYTFYYWGCSSYSYACRKIWSTIGCCRLASKHIFRKSSITTEVATSIIIIYLYIGKLEIGRRKRMKVHHRLCIFPLRGFMAILNCIFRFYTSHLYQG